MKKLIYILIGLIATGILSCSEDYLEPELQQTKRFENGIETKTDLHNLVKGIYDNMSAAEYYGRDFIVYGEVRSDNTANDFGTGRYIEVSNFNLLQSDGYAHDTWQNIYRGIQQANIAIHAEINDTTAEAKYYKGQAYVLRGLFYFDLMRLYSTMFVSGYDYGVPIVNEFDNTADNGSPSRASLEDTKIQIEGDLLTAIEMMSSAYDGTKQEISVDAAKALLSRYYLYTNQHLEAMELAYDIIQNPNYNYKYTTAINYVTQWTRDESNESIFELAYTNTDKLNTTSVGYMWNPYGYGDLSFTTDLLSTYGPNDVRYPYTESGIPVRYQDLNGNNNIRIIDYPEVVLNYVEAAYHEGDPNGDALIYLNELADVRDLTGDAPDYTSLNESIILEERRKELAATGQRYFDLLRTEQDIPAVPDSHLNSAIPYGDPVCAFPIPEAELDANPNIKNQNPGY